MSIPGSASPLFIGAAAGAAAAYQIDRSVRLNSSDSSYFSRTPSSAGNRRTFTWSGWVKRTNLGSLQSIFSSPNDGSSHRFYLLFDSNDQLRVDGKLVQIFNTEAKFTDPLAWYHFVLAVDTSQSTAANRFKLYVNGTIVSNFSVDNRSSIAQNTDLLVNTTGAHNIGRDTATGSRYLNGYLAEVHFVDGQALAATDFGEYDSDNNWNPKAYSGSYGTNGFYLKFADNSSNAALGTDSSGNSNTWTVNNLTASVSAVNAIDLDGNDSIEYPGPGDGISGDFTMECFFLMDSSASGNERIFSANQGSYSDEKCMIRRNSSGNIAFAAGNASPTYFDPSSGHTITSGVWHHAAIVRESGTVSFYYDGTRKSSASYSTSFDITKLVVGGGYGSENFNGDVHGARFTLGQALYSGSSYTVPTSQITTTSQGATASNVKVLAGTTSTVNENAGTLGNGTSSGDPTATIANAFGSPSNTDSLIDTPTNYDDGTNVGGNYATLNPLHKGSNATLKNGNLEAVLNGTLASSTNVTKTIVTGTLGVSSGKWYYEAFVTNFSGGASGNATCNIGIAEVGATYITASHLRTSSSMSGGIYTYHGRTGNKHQDGAQQSYSGSTFTYGDIIGVALDLDNGTLTFYKNGVSQGQAFSGISGTFVFVADNDTSANNMDIVVNFGQRSFAYSSPANHLAWVATNLPDPTIADGSTAMNVKTWSGDSTERAITGYNFSPDFVWIKTRSASDEHVLSDVVRGAGKVLSSSANNKESDFADPGYWGHVKSFDSDGFTVDNGAGGYHRVNQSGRTYCGWAWDAGTSTVSNTDGSITSQVRANPTAGISIVSYTGNNASSGTIGHSLNAKPGMIIVKRRGTGGNDWGVYHSALGATKNIDLNNSGSASTTSGTWNNTEPTSSVFTVGTFDMVNASDTYIAYCFAPVEGFSAMGSYVGNGSTDGPLVALSFRPAFLLLKRINATGNWLIYDNRREGYNFNNDPLYANLTDAEGTTDYLDLLSNGFKLRNTHGSVNGSSDTYIYAAFAEHPFKTARAR